MLHLQRHRVGTDLLGLAMSSDLRDERSDLGASRLALGDIDRERVLGTERFSDSVRFHWWLVDPARDPIVPATPLPEMLL